jgi:hypothetical protein
MDDAGAVRAVERIGDLDGDLERVAERQTRTAGLRRPRESVGQRLAIQVLHDEIRGAPVVADVVERTNVRMRELRDRARLTIESLTKARIAGKGLGKNLDRHLAIQTGIARPIHLAHATSAERAADLVRAKSGARRETH